MRRFNVKQMWIIRLILLGVLGPSSYVDSSYRQTTRMFGPIWLWSLVVVIILLLVGFAWSIEMR